MDRPCHRPPDRISPPSILNSWETWLEWERQRSGDSVRCPCHPCTDPPGQYSCQKGNATHQTLPAPSEPRRALGDCRFLPCIQPLHSWHCSHGSLAWNPGGDPLPRVLAPCFITCGTWGRSLDRPQFPLLIPSSITWWGSWDKQTPVNT